MPPAQRAAGTDRTGPTAQPSGAPEGAAAPAPKSGGRNPFFDNAKYLAIVLVAMGHAWEPLTDGSRAAEAFYMTVYTFHMPAFIIISGYFSRSFDMRKDRLQRLVTGSRSPTSSLRPPMPSSSAGRTTTPGTPSACSTRGS